MNLSEAIQETPLDLLPNQPMLPNMPYPSAPSHQGVTKIINADCALALKTLLADSIHLIMTSPPYANQRKHTYGGVPADRYLEWFLPRADALYRVLAPTGSFVLNIKEHAVQGERHPYVMELILALRKQGWFWTEEYIWHKSNAFPGKWPNRFRDAWERCIHFTKQKDFSMYQEAVMVPMGNWHQARFKSFRARDEALYHSQTNSGFRKKTANWRNREMAYPDNVLHLPTECRNKNHSAVFPESLPEWFIKLFTKEGDTVLDPFMGSGTTLCVAQRLARHSIGIEICAEYCDTAARRLGITQTPARPDPQGNSTRKDQVLQSTLTGPDFP